VNSRLWLHCCWPLEWYTEHCYDTAHCLLTTATGSDLQYDTALTEEACITSMSFNLLETPVTVGGKLLPSTMEQVVEALLSICLYVHSVTKKAVERFWPNVQGWQPIGIWQTNYILINLFIWFNSWITKFCMTIVIDGFGRFLTVNHTPQASQVPK